MSENFDLRKEILDKIDFLSYYREYIKDLKDLGNNQYKGFCCIHADAATGNPGFLFNSSNGLWRCMSGCGQGDIFTFVGKVYQLDTHRDFRKILEILANNLGISVPEHNSSQSKTPHQESLPKPVIQTLPPEERSKPSVSSSKVSEKSTEPIPEALNDKFKADLTPELKEILKKRRGITDQTVEMFEIGWHIEKERYTIPIRDVGGKIRNIRLYSTTSDKRWKMINYTEKKRGENGEIKITYADKTQLFPINKIKQVNPQKIIICEGEFDCMLLWQNGFNAMTSTMGGNTWCDEWHSHLDGKDVVFMYDCDEEGIEFAKKHSSKLLKANVCKTVAVVTLPLAGTKAEKDVTDFFLLERSVDELQQLISEVQSITRKDTASVTPPDIADDFKNSDNCSSGGKIILRRWRNEYYVWNGKHHKTVEDERIMADVLHFISANYDRNKATSSFANDVLKNLWNYILLPKDIDAPMTDLNAKRPTKLKNYLSMGNGVLNLAQIIGNIPVEITEHTPDIFFTYSLPYSYINSATCPRWRTFLEKVQPNEDVRDFLQEYAGYMLVPDVEYQKFLLFIGEGQNGKSVFLDVITAMLGGSDNVSSVSLSKFQDKFSLSGLVGKLANICGEVGDIEEISEEKLKAIVGGDQIEVEEKYKKPYYTKLTGKHIFSTNHLPRFKDRTLGLWRKMSVIEFGVYITDEEKDETLKLKIINEELPGIFLWALEGLVRLLQRQKFEEPQMCIDKKEEVATEINSAKGFIKDNLEIENGSLVNSAEIYKDYNDFCKQNNYKPVNEIHFGRQVYRQFGKNRVARVKSTTVLPNGSRPYCYTNLKRKDMVSDGSSYNPSQ